MRLFVAASVPDEIRAKLSTMKERLESLPVRWVRPEGIHLTLKFLGEVAEGRVRRIGEALEGAARGRPKEVVVRGIGTFPERGRPRVIWAGLGGDVAGIARLAASVEAALRPAGFPREQREFRAHLTLGRFRERPRGEWRGALNRYADEKFGAFGVEEYALYESVVQQGGARYRVVSRFAIDREEDD